MKLNPAKKEIDVAYIDRFGPPPCEKSHRLGAVSKIIDIFGRLTNPLDHQYRLEAHETEVLSAIQIEKFNRRVAGYEATAVMAGDAAFQDRATI